ncbi:MAG: hypothetical protein HFI37_08100 [Lachnospiraceae bacterium]|nr:hypothetical protein [Lachnospiraceae bacterium]
MSYYLYLFALALLLCPSKTANAAKAAKVKLKEGKTYKNYDITGDKKKDTIRIQGTKDQYGDYYEKISVIVNGKTAISWNHPSAYHINATLCTLKNGKPFLYLYFPGDNGDGVNGIFQYKKGKLKQIINNDTLKRSSNQTSKIKCYGGLTLTAQKNMKI